MLESEPCCLFLRQDASLFIHFRFLEEFPNSLIQPAFSGRIQRKFDGHEMLSRAHFVNMSFDDTHIDSRNGSYHHRTRPDLRPCHDAGAFVNRPNYFGRRKGPANYQELLHFFALPPLASSSSSGVGRTIASRDTGSITIRPPFLEIICRVSWRIWKSSDCNRDGLQIPK